MLMENKQQHPQKKKKTRDPTRDPENRPDFRPDFSGRVWFQTDKPDLFRVGFRVTVNPTRPDPISVLDACMQ